MIHFVGAGPGAPDLITVRGQKLLQEADVIIYAGSLVNPELLSYKKEGCEVYSVSCDTHFVHKAWHDVSDRISKVEYPMLGDPTGKLARDFGVMIEEEGLALRGSFVIDPEGVIKAYEIHDNGIGRSAKELLRKVQAAKFAAEHGEVCPANWKPGSDTLKPGIDLVGKL